MKKYTKRDLDVREEYKKQRRRIKRFIESAEKRGYSFEEDFIPAKLSDLGEISTKELKKLTKKLDKIRPAVLYESSEFLGEGFGEVVTDVEEVTFDKTSNRNKVNIANRSPSEYIPNFSIINQIRTALENLEFKFENPFNKQISERYRQSLLNVFDDNVNVDEEKYAEYLTQYHTEIMSEINKIQYYDSDQWEEWNGSKITLITLINMGDTPLFYDEDNEISYY